MPMLRALKISLFIRKQDSFPGKSSIYRRFSKDETFSLTSQIRRPSRSIGAQIAEAWGKRRYEKHFISKLTDADSEQQETQHWLLVSLDCGYAQVAQVDSLRDRCLEIGRMLNGMVTKADLFCGAQSQIIRERSPEYFVD
jgi:four helix bundle protein